MQQYQEMNLLNHLQIHSHQVSTIKSITLLVVLRANSDFQNSLKENLKENAFVKFIRNKAAKIFSNRDTYRRMYEILNNNI
jgi:hypothetical protein